MASILQLPAMLSEDAQAIGFAAHYRVPHLPIDVPDGGFTITVKTARGRRVTFFFGPAYGPGEPEVVHIQYHDRRHPARISCGMNPAAQGPILPFPAVQEGRGKGEVID
jgi:hypothetical protein